MSNIISRWLEKRNQTRIQSKRIQEARTANMAHINEGIDTINHKLETMLDPHKNGLPYVFMLQDLERRKSWLEDFPYIEDVE